MGACPDTRARASAVAPQITRRERWGSCVRKAANPMRIQRARVRTRERAGA